MSEVMQTGCITGKAWGWTKCALRFPGICDVWLLSIVPGGYCSQHKHDYKFNHFSVLSGELKIEVWKNDYGCIDVTTLNPGHSMVIPPGEYHRFSNQGKEPVYAIESYWGEISSRDIQRKDHGGIQ